MRGQTTDYFISGPMRGLKNCIEWRKHTDRPTDGHGNSLTYRVSENSCPVKDMCLPTYI